MESKINLPMNATKHINGDYSGVLEVLEKQVNAGLESYLNSCVHCGLCSESCHYYLSDPKPSYSPSAKVDMIASIYRRYYTKAGKLVPWLTGAREINDLTLEKMTDLAFGSCTMCGRCTIHCSVGIDIGLLVRTSRMMLAEIGIIPGGLDSTAHLAIKSGNNMGITREELVDTLQWLEDDLKMEVNDDKASIPLDRKNAKIIYTLNPREPKFFPLSISAMAKIFYAAKENWTISTKVYDVTNYSYFSGEESDAGTLAGRYKKEIEELKAENLVLGECGHGFRAYRWEGPEWMGENYPAEAISVLQLMAEYIRSGRIKTSRSLFTKRVTLHDPCNLVRNGGIIEEQRYILNNCVEDFVEMTPNRADN